MSTMPISDEPAPAWTERRFVFFRGQFDTKIETGEDYPTQLLAKIFTMVPGDKPKGAGLAMIPSTYCDYDAREHKAQRERGRFIALTGDVDSGDHDLDTIQAAVTEFVDDAAWLIYSSPHSRPGDQRWRILIPLEDEQPFETWHDAQCSFYAFMEARGIDMDHALARAAQPVYLPNVPPVHAKSETPLRGDDGKPLYYCSASSGTKAPGLPIDIGPVQFGIASIRHQRIEDEAVRERIKREAEARRASTPRGDNASLIDDFNAENSVATMLELCGYEQSLRHAEDWRSPHQTGETYATRVMGSKWVSLSASDAAAGVGERCSSGCFGDAYDLFVHYKHGGDHKGAFRALHNERRAAQGNVIYPKQFDAPEWLSEAPAYDQMPEWAEMDPDHEGGVEGVGGDSQPTSSSKVLPFEWAGKATPVIDGLWLIEDWLPKNGIAAVYGHPGSGKSFFTLDMAAAVAAGSQWAGKHVEQGLVVYVVAEGQAGFRNRLFAMQQAGKIAADAPFVFIPTPIDLQSPEGDLSALVETITEVWDQAKFPPALIVIDTLSKTFGAGKENTDDMVSYVNNCQRISSHFECCTLVVHHRPKDTESNDLRGHSSLRGNIDTTILIQAGDIKSATTLKQKDGEADIVVRFKLNSVVIGEDKRGKEITTCLTEIIQGEVAMQAMDPVERAKSRLTGHKKMALRAIEDVIANVGVEPPGEIPPHSINRYRTWKAASADQIRDRLQNEFVALSDNDSDKSGDNARRNMFRVLKDLKAAGILGSYGDFVWVN